MRHKTYDSVAKDNHNLELYYVQNSPQRKKRPSSHFDDEAERLEREMFVRLQGHKGRLLPLLEKVIRYAVYGILFPFFAILYVIRLFGAFIGRQYDRLMAILTPPWMRFCRFIGYYVQLVKNFFDRQYNRVKVTVLAIWVRVEAVLQRIFGPAISRVSRWYNTSRVFLERQKIKVLSALINLAKRTPLGRSLWLKYHAAITKRIANYRAYAIVSGDKRGRITKAHKALQQTVRQKRLRWTTWMRVLLKYSRRAMEDWTLEIKQRFKVKRDEI